MRFRNTFIGVGGLLTVLLLLISDPDGGFVQNIPFGAGTFSTMLILATGILYIGLLHFARKGLFDYIDMGVFARKASTDPVGSAIVFLGVTVAMLAIAIVILAATI
jgi:hypothetical protein